MRLRLFLLAVEREKLRAFRPASRAWMPFVQSIRRLAKVIAMAGASLVLTAADTAPLPIPPLPPAPHRRTAGAPPAEPSGTSGKMAAHIRLKAPTLAPEASPGVAAVASAPRTAAAVGRSFHAATPAIVDQLLALAFDADPRSGIPARTVLPRWITPLMLFVYGDASARALVLANAGQLQTLIGLPITPIAAGQPNLFVAVTDDPVASFAGPLHRLLTLAFAGDEEAVSDFLAAVVGTQGCWALPVWGDPARSVLKAAIVGVDARQGNPALAKCVARKLAAAVGLFGPDGNLPHSVFNPIVPTASFSWEDRLMIRALYAPELAAGQDRAAVLERATAAVLRLRGRLVSHAPPKASATNAMSASPRTKAQPTPLP